METIARAVKNNTYASLWDLPIHKQVGLLAILSAHLPISLRKKAVLVLASIMTLFYREKVEVVTKIEWPEIQLPNLFVGVSDLSLYLGGQALAWLLGVVGLCIIGYTTRYFFAGLSCLAKKRRFRRVKSFRPEAMRDGSNFEPGRKPSCQVPVWEVGVFSDTLIGYGLRMEDYLVIPSHVMASVEWPVNELAVGEGKRKMLLEMERFVDPMFDVSFFYLEADHWATLGVSKGSFVDSVVPDGTRAWCTGKSGRSQGVLKQSSPGMYVYTGSTEPGMSGSAYESQGGILGMHVGAGGTNNLGISSVYLWRRQELLVQEESKRSRNRGVTGLKAYDDPGQLMERAKQRWGAEDINDLLFAARSGEEDVTRWLDKHRQTLGVHRYSYENDAPKVVKRVTEEVIPPSPCSCKNLFHSCEALRGKANTTQSARKQETPEVYIGQADNQVLVTPPEVPTTLAGSLRLLEEAVEDNHAAVVRLTGENQELREQVSFLEKRLTVLEVWSIARGYDSIPRETLTEESAQLQALKNYQSGSKSVVEPYVGESRKIVTPPIVRKLKGALKSALSKPAEKPLELKARPTKHHLYKVVRDKQQRTEEEQKWMEGFLKERSARRALQRRRRSELRKSSSSSTQS